jgi:hypothetical protein
MPVPGGSLDENDEDYEEEEPTEQEVRQVIIGAVQPEVEEGDMALPMVIPMDLFQQKQLQFASHKDYVQRCTYTTRCFARTST